MVPLICPQGGEELLTPALHVTDLFCDATKNQWTATCRTAQTQMLCLWTKTKEILSCHCRLRIAQCQLTNLPEITEVQKRKSRKNGVKTDRVETNVVTSRARGGNYADPLLQTLPSNFLAS